MPDRRDGTPLRGPWDQHDALVNREWLTTLLQAIEELCDGALHGFDTSDLNEFLAAQNQMGQVLSQADEAILA